MSMSAQESFDEPVAAINVTPLVDVMLVLLVIFMVTAPILQQGVEVNLPKASTSALTGSAEQVVVSIDKDGALFVGAGNKVDLAQLGPRLSAIMDVRPENERKVYIKADRAISYGKIMEVMGKVHSSGIRQIGLVSEAESR